METMVRTETSELIEQSKVLILGRISLGTEGPHQIESTTPDSELPALFEEARQRLVKVEDQNAACCIDGRCAVCAAASIDSYLANRSSLETESTIERVPIRPHVPGGTYHFATLMAIAANIPLIAEVKTFDEAKAKVGAFLKDNGIDDAAHSTVAKIKDANFTGCGAQDEIVPGMEDANTESHAYDQNGDIGPIAETMAPLYGYTSARDFMAENDLYPEIRHNVVQALVSNKFAGYSPAHERDALVARQPENMELFDSPHTEQGIAIVEMEGVTIDRDANQGKLFIYDRWFANKLAYIMAGTPLGQRRLLMAGDYITLLVTNQLVAPGQPVAILKAR